MENGRTSEKVCGSGEVGMMEEDARGQRQMIWQPPRRTAGRNRKSINLVNKLLNKDEGHFFTEFYIT